MISKISTISLFLKNYNNLFFQKYCNSKFVYGTVDLSNRHTKKGTGMKNRRLLLLMSAVAMLDWVITRVSLKQVELKTIAHVKKAKGAR